jgi:putative transposase
MTNLSSKDIFDLPGIPSSRMGVWKWLKRNGIPLTQDGKRFTFHLSDLPEDVRLAYVRRECEAAGLVLGTYDEAAHAEFATKPPKMRAVAERKAEIARFMHGAKGLPWGKLEALVQERFGQEGTSGPSLRRLQRAVEGVDPINFAPALVADYSIEGAPRKEISEGAWSYFLTTIKKGGPQFPLKQAWRDVRDLAATMGWTWPSRETVFRRWAELSPAQKLHARHGHEATVKVLAMPAMRDKQTIKPMECVSLDGRTKDFWVTINGKRLRLTFLALVDCATGYVLGWELAESENARATVRLIKRVCQTYGIFDRLYTDNGSAFAGHLVAGGAVHKFRNAKSTMRDVKPLGICHHLGIKVHFALPDNGQAKAAERTFATLSRVIDDRPEFAGAHAGHAPGASPNDRITPVDLEVALAVIEREVARHNAEPGRRGQGMRGRSYQAAFLEGFASRVRRTPTARQLYLAGLIYTPVKVNRWGRVQIDKWTYGGPETQEALLPYHGQGEILLGRDPDDYSAPALAWNAENKLICEGIEPVRPGDYGSKDTAREAARLRKAARDASRKAAEANGYMADAEFAAITRQIPTPGIELPEGSKTVAGRFGGSLQTRAKGGGAKGDVEALRKRKSAITEEMWANAARAEGWAKK